MPDIVTTYSKYFRVVEGELAPPNSRFDELGGDFKQFMRSSGIFWTKYSRCSVGMVHMGRFFCVISSSRFLSSRNKFGNQIKSHEQISGLSGMREHKDKSFDKIYNYSSLLIIKYSSSFTLFSRSYFYQFFTF